MREIWEEAANFKTTSQKLAEQARMILKKGCFSKLEKIEICGQVSHKEYDQQEQCKRDETQNMKNQNLREPNTTAPMLIPNERNNVGLIKNHHKKEEDIIIPKESRLGKSQGRN